MRFLRLLKRSVLIIIFTIGLLFSLWLAFIAKPQAEFIGRAEAAPSRTAADTKPNEPKPAATAALPTTRTASLPTAESSNTYIPSAKLIIPVLGVRPEQLYDSFGDSRSEGRSHRALDIPAHKGTPVVAATDGVVKRIFYSERGGKTLYQLGSDGKTVYYYAHLDSYANTIAEGSAVKQGEVIAYVGDTGNAGAGNCHLHFAMWAVLDPKRIWEGNNINPYPLLH